MPYFGDCASVWDCTDRLLSWCGRVPDGVEEVLRSMALLCEVDIVYMCRCLLWHYALIDQCACTGELFLMKLGQIILLGDGSRSSRSDDLRKMSQMPYQKGISE